MDKRRPQSTEKFVKSLLQKNKQFEEQMKNDGKNNQRFLYKVSKKR